MEITAVSQLAEHLDDITPVERHGDVLVKREDKFGLGGVSGSKLRTLIAMCQELPDDAPLVIASTSLRSPPAYGTVASAATNRRCHVFVGHRKDPAPAVKFASEREHVDMHYVHKGSYLSVIRKRARNSPRLVAGTTLTSRRATLPGSKPTSSAPASWNSAPAALSCPLGAPIA